MASDDKRQEDKEKLAEQDEQMERLRQEAHEDSPAAAVQNEMGREMHDKDPGEAARDDLKALKEQVKEWVERDQDDSSQT